MKEPAYTSELNDDELRFLLDQLLVHLNLKIYWFVKGENKHLVLKTPEPSSAVSGEDL